MAQELRVQKPDFRALGWYARLNPKALG